VPLSHGFADGNVRIVGLADFARAIRAGRPHRCNGEVAFHVLEVMEAFGASSQQGRAVPIKSRCERPTALPRQKLLGELN
jgi:predicted dehydrogenase